MKPLAAILALVVFSTSVFADGAYQNEDELRLVQVIAVYMRDNVTDGCLSNPNALKVEAELVLRRSGITVTDATSQANYVLLLTPTGGSQFLSGGQPSGRCFVDFDVELYRYAQVSEGHLALVPAYEHGGLSADYTKAETQEILRTTVSEIVSDLANEILKSRGN